MKPILKLRERDQEAAHGTDVVKDTVLWMAALDATPVSAPRLVSAIPPDGRDVDEDGLPQGHGPGVLEVQMWYRIPGCRWGILL